MIWLALWIAAGGWFVAVWYGMQLATARHEAESRAYAARQARAEVAKLEAQLDGAYTAIGHLQEQCRTIALEKPMTFRDVPFYHAAHLHPAERGMFITWDN